MEGNHKRHIASTEESENQDNSKRISLQDNKDNPNNTKSNNTNKKAHPTAKIVIQKHPYNVSVPRLKAGTLDGNCIPQKMLLSHDQIFNLVTHCLDDSEIPMFLNSYQCIKIKPTNLRVSVPSFLDCVPPLYILKSLAFLKWKKYARHLLGQFLIVFSV